MQPCHRSTQLHRCARRLHRLHSAQSLRLSLLVVSPVRGHQRGSSTLQHRHAWRLLSSSPSSTNMQVAANASGQHFRSCLRVPVHARSEIVGAPLCCAAADAVDGSPLAQARAQERRLMEATDRWNAVTAHQAATEQLKSELWETKLQVGLPGMQLAPTGKHCMKLAYRRRSATLGQTCTAADDQRAGRDRRTGGTAAYDCRKESRR